MNKHTPGPWHSDHEYVVGLVQGGRPGGEVIGRFSPTVDSLRGKTPDKENAALAAAAPQLLAALKAILPVYKDWTEDGGHDPSVGIDATGDWIRIENAEKAIAKAEGADK